MTRFTFIVALVAWLLCAGSVSAQNTVVVLGLSSEEGDDELAANMTNALRDAVGSVPEWEQSDTKVNASQMAMVHDCDITNDACTAKVANGLNADYVVYGRLVESGDGIRVQVRLYQHSSATVAATAQTSIKAGQTSEDVLLGRADSVVSQLRGEDEEPAAEPAPAAPPVVKAPARPEREPYVDESDDGGRGTFEEILPYGLIGIAGVSAGLAVMSWLKIDSAGDENFETYRRAIGEMKPNATDVCAEADADNMAGLSAAEFADVKDSCSSGQSFETLQWVFVGVAAVSGGIGVYMLVDRAGEDEDEGLSLHPRFGSRGASVTATLAF